MAEKVLIIALVVASIMLGFLWGGASGLDNSREVAPLMRGVHELDKCHHETEFDATCCQYSLASGSCVEVWCVMPKMTGWDRITYMEQCGLPVPDLAPEVPTSEEL